MQAKGSTGLVEVQTPGKEHGQSTESFICFQVTHKVEFSVILFDEGDAEFLKKLSKDVRININRVGEI